MQLSMMLRQSLLTLVYARVIAIRLRPCCERNLRKVSFKLTKAGTDG